MAPKFLERLPAKCPPESATDVAIDCVYRVVTSKKPTIDDFKSHAALNLPIRPKTDPCRWSSCSLFLDKSKAAEIAFKLPKPRFGKPSLAMMSIARGCGMSVINVATSHVDFWMYADFDPIKAIQKMEKVSGT
jgi:hypothetical protein